MAEKAKIIKASRELQQKVGRGTIDEKVVAKAQKVIEENKVDFTPIAMPLIKDLEKAIAEARTDLSKPGIVEAITQPIMNLKGNAGIFKFPLVSEMTGTVLTLIEHVGRVDKDIIVIVDNLHKACLVSVTQKLASREDPIAAQLIKEFEGVCRRYMEKRT